MHALRVRATVCNHIASISNRAGVPTRASIQAWWHNSVCGMLLHVEARGSGLCSSCVQSVRGYLHLVVFFALEDALKQTLLHSYPTLLYRAQFFTMPHNPHGCDCKCRLRLICCWWGRACRGASAQQCVSTFLSFSGRFVMASVKTNGTADGVHAIAW